MIDEKIPGVIATSEPTGVIVDGAVSPPAKKRRGFAAMDREKVSEIARKGGQAAQRAGTAHRFTSAEARAAGRKGGAATHRKKTNEENGQ